MRLKNQFVEKLPIPTWDDSRRKELARLSQAATQAAQERWERQSSLRQRIPDLCPPAKQPEISEKLKLGRKLMHWWELPDFAAFRTEVKKVFKADIPLRERSDWEAWITQDRGEITRLSAEIERAEADINRIIYDLFALTAAEITLLEAALAKKP